MGVYQKTKYPGIFKYIGKKGEVYGIDYYAGGKKHREIVGPLLTEARKKLEERRAMAKAGHDSIIIRKKITFEQLAVKYSEVQKGERYFEKAQKYYVPILKEFFKGKKLYQITPLDIEEFKNLRKNTPTRAGKIRSEVAVNRELETLRSMLNKAKEWNWLEENPFNKFQKPILFPESEGRVRYLTEEELQRLFSLWGNPDPKKRPPLYLKYIIQTALLTALRKTDLLNLKWSNIDLDRGILFYEEQKKRNKPRIKVLNSDMIELLKSIPKRGEYVFTGNDGEPLRDIKRSFRTALKRAEIKNFHFHDLRHCSASYLVMRGASLKAVQEHLGHTSLAMTERYMHLTSGFQRAEIEKLNGLFLPDSKKLVRNEDLAIFQEEKTLYANA